MTETVKSRCVTFSLAEIKDNKITKATFTGVGCAISQASISMLTEHLIGKTVEQAKALTKQDILEFYNG